jgi:hypothetical protein
MPCIEIVPQKRKGKGLGVVVENLLLLLPKLSETERKLITDAIHDYDPEKPVIDLRKMALLDRKHVIAALRKFYRVNGTTAALRLARKVECERSTQPCVDKGMGRLRDD